MEFLREQPVVSLAEPGKTDTFIADVFQPRPAFDEIASSGAWCTKAGEKMHQAMGRKNCAVSWVQLVVDQCGLLAMLRFEHTLILGDAKKAAGVILRCLPDEQRRAVEQNLRPLDEVDYNRIAAWQTVASLRPAVGKRKREEDYQPLAKRAKTLAEFLDECSSEEEEVVPPRLILTNGDSTSSTPSLLDSAGVWEFRAKAEATIVLAEAGERPAQLVYIRCHREARRQLLLQSNVRERWETPNMHHVVSIAAQLAKDGSLPGPLGQHGRKNEFIKRCAAALQAIDPSQETDIKNLSAKEQLLIRHALGGEGPPYEGCMSESCLDKKPAWITVDMAVGRNEPLMPMSRCAHCNLPRSFGRSFTEQASLMEKKRQRGLHKYLVDQMQTLGKTALPELPAVRYRGWDWRPL